MLRYKADTLSVTIKNALKILLVWLYAFVGVSVAYAQSSTIQYFYQVNVLNAIGYNGSGTIHASNAEEEGTLTTVKGNSQYRNAPIGKQYYYEPYLFATANSKSIFMGWANNADGTNIIEGSNVSPYHLRYGYKGTSYDESKPELHIYYAVFYSPTVLSYSTSIEPSFVISGHSVTKDIKITFEVKEATALTDFNVSLTGDSHFSLLGEPLWLANTDNGRGGYSVTYMVRYASDATHGIFEATLKLSSRFGNSSQSCTFTAENPVVTITSATSDDVYATFRADAETQTPVAGTAVFDVGNVDDDSDFASPFIMGLTVGAKWSVVGQSYFNGKLTVNYLFNGNKQQGTHTATLTVSTTAQAGGAKKSVTLTAHNDKEADDDAQVTDVNGSLIYKGTWTTALKRANANPNSTLTLLRNVAVNAKQTTTQTFTLDFCGRTLSGSVSGPIINHNGNGKVLTLTDSKSGGGVRNIGEYNARIYAVYVTAGELIVNGGVLHAENNAIYNSDTQTKVGVSGISQAAGTVVTINSGTIEAIGGRAAYGLYANSSVANNTILNVNGGTVYAEAPYTAYGVAGYNQINISDGYITAKINTNIVDSKYTATHTTNLDNANARGVLIMASANADPAKSYYGTLTMTGGMVNVISERERTKKLKNYGIAVSHSTVAMPDGQTAVDGMKTQKVCAKAKIENVKVNVVSDSYNAIGIAVMGSYNACDNTFNTVSIKNAIVNVSCPAYTYGIIAEAAVNATHGACSFGDIELTDVIVTAKTTKGENANALYVVAAANTVYTENNPLYAGEYAIAAKMTVNSGTYKAESKTKYANGVATDVRARSLYSPDISSVENRRLGGNAEAYPQLTIHNGLFNAVSGTSYAKGLSSGGHTIVDGGRFEATATTYNAVGMYAQSGTLTATSATAIATANGVVNKTTNTDGQAYGVQIDAVVPMDKEAPTGFAHAATAQLNDLTVNATTITGSNARAVSVATISKQYTTAQLHTDSLNNKWSKSTYQVYSAICPLNQWRVAAAECEINGGIYTATAETAKAYGVYMANTAVSGDGMLTASGGLVVRNARFNAMAKNGATGFGIRAGGQATISNCSIDARANSTSAIGIYVADKQTTVDNTTIYSTAPQSTQAAYVSASVGNAGELLYGRLHLLDGNHFHAHATAEGKAYGIYVAGATATKGTNDYASAAELTIDGGEYIATSENSTAYAISVVKQQSLNAALAIPQCVVNAGKFSGTTAEINTNGVVNHTILHGGYYAHNTNLSTYVSPDKLLYQLSAAEPVYADGYRYTVSSDTPGGEVCRIYEGDVLRGSYNSLEEALQYVNSNVNKYLVIVMTTHYTLAAGDYVLPEKARLLIPYKDGEGRGATSLIGANVVHDYNNGTYVKPYMFRRLTLAPGANLTVQGYIEVSGAQYPAKGGRPISGCVQGAYGQLHLQEGARLDLESTAKLFAWGFVTGDGIINAKRNSYIYEDFQMGYWRGGAQSYAMRKNEYKAFFITDYCFQNIECPIRYRAGANSVGYSSVYATYDIHTVDNVRLVGTEEAMFVMDVSDERDDTWLMRDYDQDNDRVNWTLNSGVRIENMHIVMSDIPLLGTIDMDSKDYNLPVTSNFTITLTNGRFEMTNDILFMPGTQLIINKEATAVVSEGKKIYFYDSADWAKTGTYYYWPALYSPSWGTNNPRVSLYPQDQPLPDAEVFVHGTFEVNGELFTTGDRVGSANIHSTNADAGSIVFNADATGDGILGQCINLVPEYVSTPITSAQLRNGNGTYTQTDGTQAGYTFVYVNNRWVRQKQDGCFTTISDNAGLHRFARPSNVVEVEANRTDQAYHNVNNTSQFYIFTEQKTSNPACVWWEATYKGVVDGQVCYMASNRSFDNYGTYYYYSDETGYWVPKLLIVTWKNYDGSVLQYADGSETIDPVPYNTSPRYYGQNPVRPNTSVYQYAWVGWTIEGDNSGTIYDKFEDLPTITENTTFIAYIEANMWQFTVSFKRKDGTLIEDVLVHKGDIPVCSVNPPTMPPTVDKIFTFTNWEGYQPNQPLSPVTRSMTYYALFSSVPRTYKVVFYDGDAHSILAQPTLQYGINAYFSATEPYKESNNAYSFDFNGWKGADGTLYAKGQPLPPVAGETYYIAQYVQVPHRYKVTFITDNGEPNETKNWFYGELPEYSKDVPVKSSTPEWIYEFDHWEPNIVEVTADAIYTAVYTQTKRQYSVRFVADDGVTDLVAPQLLDYGTMPTIPEPPEKIAPPGKIYVFNGWTPNVQSVSEDVVYRPTYILATYYFGNYIDIIDWNDNTLTISMNGYIGRGSGYQKSQWKLTIDGIDDELTFANLDKQGLCSINIADLDVIPDDDITISAYDYAGELESHRKYIVPYVVNENSVASDLLSDAFNQSVVLVRQDTLFIDADISLAAIYVYPSAHLVVNEGVQLEVGKLIMRMRPFILPPTLTVNGTLNVNQMFYSYISTDNCKSYQFGLPYDADLRKVTTSNDCLNRRFSDAGLIPYGSMFGILYYNVLNQTDDGVISPIWKEFVPTADYIIKGTTGYQIIAASDHYYEFYFPVEYQPTHDAINITYVSNANSSANLGWNYIVSPLTADFYIDTAYISPEDRVKITELVCNPTTKEESFRQYIPDVIHPTAPFYFQAPSSGLLTLTDNQLLFTGNSSAAHSMPWHEQKKQVLTQWINLIATDAEGHTDQTSIFLHPDKFTSFYQQGYDLTKFGNNNNAFAIYCSLEYGNLAFAALPDQVVQSGIALTINNVVNGQNSVSLQRNKYLSRLQSLLLLDQQQGVITDLLLSDYQFDAQVGHISERFYLYPIFKSAGVVTNDTYVDDCNYQIQVSNHSVIVNINGDGHANGSVQMSDLAPISCFDMLGKLIYFNQAPTSSTIINIPTSGIFTIQIGTSKHKIVVP